MLMAVSGSIESHGDDRVVDLVRAPATPCDGVVAVGSFDGVHRGHAYLVARAAEIARRIRAPLAVLTFSPHPRLLFRPDDCFLITEMGEQVAALNALGVDMVFVQRFTREFAAITATEFADRILVAGLGARHVVIGEDFCFGKGREGGVDMLAELGSARGFGVTTVAPLCDETGRPYSSTRVRDAIAIGDMRLAANLLGRPWRVSGTPGGCGGALALKRRIRPPAGRYLVEVDGRRATATVERGAPEHDRVRIDHTAMTVAAAVDFIQPAAPEHG